MELNKTKQTLLRLPEVIKRTGLSRSTIYAYSDNGSFPRPVKIGLRAVAWCEAEIDAWIKSKVA